MGGFSKANVRNNDKEGRDMIVADIPHPAIVKKFETAFDNFRMCRVNSDFIIRVYPALKGKKGTNSLITSKILVGLLGQQLAQDTINRAYISGLDTFSKKFRRGIRIEFTGR